MARVPKNSPLYQLRGRVGDWIIYERNGKVYMRAAPQPKKNHKSTAQQDLHQKSFQAIHTLAKSVKRSIIDRVWATLPMTGGMTPYSLFVKSNWTAFGHTDQIQFPELMEISRGNLLPAVGFSVKKDGDQITFRWDASKTGWLAMADNRLNLVRLTDRLNLEYIAVEARRGDGEASVIIQDQTEMIEGFVFWSSFDETAFSPSMHWKCE
ncbi:MAG: hypothetical protein Q8928_02045 [Bacteroidota bacterium]|nr:hypothetical protein [Bacteroidota bacterium]